MSWELRWSCLQASGSAPRSSACPVSSEGASRFHLNYFDYESLSGLLARRGLHEIDRLASFPIEMFLLMGEDYVGNSEVGSECHGRRMRFERSLIETGQRGELMQIYRALARAGVGRTCGILARKET